MDFKVQFLDHVAIRVKDFDKSITWYERVLHLKKYELEEWGAFPVFMMAGKSGVALFPADERAGEMRSVDHFAFHVTQKDFKAAQEHFNELGLEFSFQDHHYFHSIYTKDPDGHKVELTCLVVDEAEFYGSPDKQPEK